MKTIYELKLHETLELPNQISVLRVENGWIYTKTLLEPIPYEQRAGDPRFVEYRSTGVTSCFVPLSREVQGEDRENLLNCVRHKL